MSCCEFGGIDLNINGQNYTARGEFTFNLNNTMRESIVNENGSRTGIVRPKLASAEGTLDGCSFDPALWDECDITAVFTLQRGNLIYTFTNASVEGSPELNSSTGEVSGFRIVTDRRVIIQRRQNIN